jgi:hypothetical protein
MEMINELKKEIAINIDDLFELFSTNSTELYLLQTPSIIKRYDEIKNLLEKHLYINEARALLYPYTVKVDSFGNDEFSIPARNISTIINSIQSTISIFSNSAFLNLVNILHGSTILCFDYDQSLYQSMKNDIFTFENKLAESYATLMESDEKNTKREIMKIIPQEKNAKKFLNLVKRMSPIPGGNVNSVHIFQSSDKLTNTNLTAETREKINHVFPSKRKDIRVDWEKNTAYGYIREINNVTKSFLVYEDRDTDIEDHALIKIHYKEDSFEDEVLNKFNKKKILINFSKDKYKYFVEKIK